MARAAKVARARELRDQGLKPREIGERMGAARKTVDGWLNDPDGSKLRARKDSYRGTCRRCGAKTTGSAGRAKAPEHCHGCASELGTWWTRERVVEAIQEFEQRYGYLPSATDWNPALARRLGHGERSERFYRDNCWPASKTVQSVFGTWNAAIEAAGFEPRKRGRKAQAHPHD